MQDNLNKWIYKLIKLSRKFTKCLIELPVTQSPICRRSADGFEKSATFPFASEKRFSFPLKLIVHSTEVDCFNWTGVSF